ncbi:hypothetical protein HPB48_012423 [Haemaphysalis longicornis]|uniref:Uncharacterized protein n=1 Tax=Haemaphysalis longicornis TaxID=44386 RepID=A0A9J6FZW9_HAELO|nr:hypothetical protein HPB48_012423 [Haemaphysalis longicornis]
MRTRDYSAIIDLGASSGSRKKSATDDTIRRLPDAATAGKSGSEEDRKSDKRGAKPAEKAESTTDKSSETASKQEHPVKRHKHGSKPCCCPMYEVEMARVPAKGGAVRQGPSDRLGMQVVATETVTKRQYTYNLDIDLPEGVRVSPRGKLVEDQGVSAEQDYDGYAPFIAEPAYGQEYAPPPPTYAFPQQPQLVGPRQLEPYQPIQVARPGSPYQPMQAAPPGPPYQRPQAFGVLPQQMPQQMPPAPQQFPVKTYEPPAQLQRVQIVQGAGGGPKKADSIVFQCVCGHDNTTTTTSSATRSKSKTTSTKASSGDSKKNGAGGKHSRKNSKDSKDSSKSNHSGKKHGRDKKGSSTSSSSTANSSTTTASSAKAKKAGAHNGFIQVQIHCDKCRFAQVVPRLQGVLQQAETDYLQGMQDPDGQGEWYAPNQYRPQQYEPEGYQNQQQFEGALPPSYPGDRQPALVVTCRSRTIMQRSDTNLAGGQYYGDPYGQAVTTNILLGVDMLPYYEYYEAEESNGTTTTTTASSTSTEQARSPRSGTRSPTRTGARSGDKSPIKNGHKSPSKATPSGAKSLDAAKSKTAPDERGSSLCKCGHDGRTCKVCADAKPER